MLILKIIMSSQIFVAIEILAAKEIGGIEGDNKSIKKFKKLSKIGKLSKSGNLKNKKLSKFQKLAKKIGQTFLSLKLRQSLAAYS